MKKLLIFITFSILFSSCSSYTISKESLITQLKENQNVARESNVSSLGTNYYSNNIKKIKCVNKNGQEVWLYSGKNMNLKITNLSTKKSLSMYFDTVYFQNDSLFGLKSRILGGKRTISTNDIGKVVINVEEAITEEIN